jgi:hypothetical protein
MTPRPVKLKMAKQLDRTEQLRRLQARYARRHKDAKARMLDESCERHGYSRGMVPPPREWAGPIA